MKYKIEKNIPLPSNKKGKLWSKWSFVPSLDNGDSFVIDERDRNGFYQFCRNRKIKVVTRLSDGSSRKVRIWVYPQKEEQ